jgi:hypothetical protein
MCGRPAGRFRWKDSLGIPPLLCTLLRKTFYLHKIVLR